MKPDDELFWLAFCYVSGEMSAEEEQAFELRLEEDPAARQTVAEVVDVAAAVSEVALDARPLAMVGECSPVEATKVTHPSGKLVGVAIAAMAAGVLLTAFALSVPRLRQTGPVAEQTDDPNEPGKAGEAMRQLALHWSALREQPADEELVEPWDMLGEITEESGIEPAVVDGAATESSDEGFADEEDEVPRWLLIAAAGMPAAEHEDR